MTQTLRFSRLRLVLSSPFFALLSCMTVFVTKRAQPYVTGYTVQFHEAVKVIPDRAQQTPSIAVTSSTAPPTPDDREINNAQSPTAAISHTVSLSLAVIEWLRKMDAFLSGQFHAEVIRHNERPVDTHIFPPYVPPAEVDVLRSAMDRAEREERKGARDVVRSQLLSLLVPVWEVVVVIWEDFDTVGDRRNVVRELLAVTTSWLSKTGYTEYTSPEGRHERWESPVLSTQECVTLAQSVAYVTGTPLLREWTAVEESAPYNDISRHLAGLDAEGITLLQEIRSRNTTQVPRECYNILCGLVCPHNTTHSLVTETAIALAITETGLVRVIADNFSPLHLPLLRLLFNRLGMNMDCPRAVLDLLGIGPCLSLAETVGGEHILPPGIALPIPPLERDDYMSELYMRAPATGIETTYPTLSQTTVDQWTDLLNLVLRAGHHDSSVLADLLAVTGTQHTPFVVCLSHDVADSLSTLLEATLQDADACLERIGLVLQVASLVVTADHRLFPHCTMWFHESRHGWSEAPCEHSAVDYDSKACTRTLLESGVLDLIHRWLGAIARLPARETLGGRSWQQRRPLDLEERVSVASASIISSMSRDRNIGPQLSQYTDMIRILRDQDLPRVSARIDGYTYESRALKQRLEFIGESPVARSPEESWRDLLSSTVAAIGQLVLSELDPYVHTEMRSLIDAEMQLVMSNSEAPFLSCIIGVLTDTLDSIEAVHAYDFLTVSLLPQVLSLSLTDGVYDSAKTNAALDQCVFKGTNEALLPYAAALCSQEEMSDEDLFKAAARVGQALSYIHTVLTWPVDAPPRVALEAFLATHIDVVERLVVGTDALSQSIAGCEYVALRETDDEVRNWRYWPGYELRQIALVPAHLSERISQLVGDLFTGGAALVEGAESSDVLMGALKRQPDLEMNHSSQMSVTTQYPGKSIMERELQFWQSVKRAAAAVGRLARHERVSYSSEGSWR
ncbi:hypothetical protein KIPB_000955 [Kipferlia bialata]|uniref:Uncharacterized protein n=1 Tax=Kipferlia bialata TaxID=797122 RepID=A0A9K3CPL0_9EUKA|nr:hypothetical protein KIPB_000955 [Kipferlia bialata]|eukprot:g955.t1